MMMAKFDPQNVPDTFRCGLMKLGCCYAMDVMQMDAFAEIKNYAGRVCIVHGTKDKIVDVSYAKRAAEAYKSTMPVAPQNSGLSDMKIFVFNRFCNTFFKNVFSGR